MFSFSRIAKRLLSYLLILAIFLYLVRIVDLDAAVATYRNTNLTSILLALSLSFLYPLIGAARWKAVLFAFDEKLSIRKALNDVMIAFSANLLLPAKAGDFIKVFVTEAPIPKAKLASGVVAERMGDLAALALLIALGGLLMGNNLFIGIGLIMLLGFATLIAVSSKYYMIEERFKFKILKIVFDSLRLWAINIKYTDIWHFSNMLLC